ncbi:MAG TPA: site-2 protease family protein [bacterium]
MLNLLFSGQYALFGLIVIALIISLTVHEFGHAAVAYLFGDDTAQRAGRLTLNPAAHLDPIGLLMVIMVGFGFAKPVPTDSRNFRSRWAELAVSAAGPGMNLLLAVLAINAYVLALDLGYLTGPGERQFFLYLTLINLVLMLFNLIPLGALDGHYILPYFLSRRMARSYVEFNARYGNMVLMGLILLSMVGIPVFSYVMRVGQWMMPWIILVPSA